MCTLGAPRRIPTTRAGRVYDPRAIYTDGSTVTIVFAGYNTPQPSSNLADYRTIGQSRSASRWITSFGPVASNEIDEEVRFAADSAVEGSGFELVWGFSCQVVVLGFAESSLLFGDRPAQWYGADDLR